jgi:hypothetical protein
MLEFNASVIPFNLIRRLAPVSQTDAELQSLLAQGTDGTFHRS